MFLFFKKIGKILVKKKILFQETQQLIIFIFILDLDIYFIEDRDTLLTFINRNYNYIYKLDKLNRILNSNIIHKINILENNLYFILHILHSNNNINNTYNIIR